MNQNILKRLDEKISAKLWENGSNPDCFAGAAVCVVHRGEEVYRKEYGYADKERKILLAREGISLHLPRGGCSA